MLQKVSIEGIQFPRLYIAENANDVYIAQQNGIPYVRWKYGQAELVRVLLRPTLEKMFPGIKWDAVLGKKKPVRSNVIICPGHIDDDEHEVAEYDKDKMLEAQHNYDQYVDDLDHEWNESLNEDGEHVRDVPIADSQRDCCNDYSSMGYEGFRIDSLRVQDYIGDLSSSVDIDALQKLGLLPKFVGDVTDCIKHNLSQSMRWTEGYTKKLGYPLGKFNNKAELPNLLIIDISASIPDGIAATMLTLADTLRSQCNADLIITSRRSGYYPAGCELPKPQTLRDYYGRSNESVEFMRILEKHVAGREWGHVISFGDYDSCGSINNAYDWHTDTYVKASMVNTKVHEVHHYHTSSCTDDTGYARWVKECCPNVTEHHDNSWCRVMNKKYKMK